MATKAFHLAVNRADLDATSRCNTSLCTPRIPSNDCLMSALERLNPLRLWGFTCWMSFWPIVENPLRTTNSTDCRFGIQSESGQRRLSVIEISGSRLIHFFSVKNRHQFWTYKLSSSRGLIVRRAEMPLVCDLRSHVSCSAPAHVMTSRHY